MTASKQSHLDSAWKRSLKPAQTSRCRMYSGKLLMMDKEDARNMYGFITEQIGKLVRLVGYYALKTQNITT